MYLKPEKLLNSRIWSR